MKANNKVLMIIVLVVLIISVGLTAYFKANPKTVDTVEEESVTTSALEGPSLEVAVSQNENFVELTFSNNYIFTNPDEVVNFTYGVTVDGSSEFNINGDSVEFLPNSNGDMYTLTVTPNYSPAMDPNIVTANYESTFTNAEFIEEENKIVIYFGGTFTFTDDKNTVAHDINENFEIILSDYVQ